MDLLQISEQERHSKRYAEEFFNEEAELKGLFEYDTKILDSVIKSKGRILDAAMGPGRHVKHFAERGFEVWGNDFNIHMIEAARKYVKKRRVKFTNHDMRRLDSIKSGYFDYVICMGASIGSVYKKIERQKAVNELARVTKKGGLVFIHAHNLLELTEIGYLFSILNTVKNSILSPKKFEVGDFVYYHSESFKKAYLHWFTPRELGRLIEKAGLKVEREFYLKGSSQDRIIDKNAFLRCFRSGGFIFVGRKA